MLLNILFPIFAVVALGYFSAKTGFIQSALITGMSQFVIKIALPAFLLQALASKDLAQIWHPTYFLAYGLGSLLIYAIGFYLCRGYFKSSLTESSVLAVGGSMSNTGFIGTAVLTLLIGSHAAVYLSLTLIVENLLIVTLMMILAERGLHLRQDHHGQMLKDTLLRICKNPVILSIVLGIGCVLMGIKLPDVVAQTLKGIGLTASPLALFVIGASLMGMQFKQMNLQGISLVLIKGILMPLVIFGSLKLFGADRETLYVGTLIAVLPMPIVFGIFAQYYGVQDKALPALVLSTVFGFVITSIWLTQAVHYLS
ncbi:transporter [Acinetobacter sp. NCu2D-2]|uniref:AEC family transporter n=1 Tax=Acinetobacter sp. NCu2D-2 TaxID=1608473 RepID=UPI0007CDEF8C|nr:AEC family transporter [Acinetobacter sp. NCu2D-2]ANF82404.1 transporter [Acinetobacter sp. NCu2D-2]